MEVKKILIVDKDESTLDLFSSRLQARGYDVRITTTSEQALRLVNDEPPDLILIDAEMEKISGKELPRVIKQTTHNFFIPIIMMVGHGQIAEQIMGLDRGFDDIIFKPCNSLELQTRIKMNLRRMQQSIQANPLTRLPGNIAITHKINECIASGEKFSVCYIDIDNFKSFNDTYGFEKGDDAIVQVARILLHGAVHCGNEDIFVGHVGGDDFIVILRPDLEEKFASYCIKEFDRLMPTHYSREDQERGKITVIDRRGRKETFPLMTVSIAAVTNAYRAYSNLGEIAETAAEVKKFLKTQPGSNYLRDRREQQLEHIDDATRLLSFDKDKKEKQKKESLPLGQILLRAELITEEQLKEALKQHFTSGQRLGRILIQRRWVSSEKVGEMLEGKLGVPYISLKNLNIPPKVQRIFTREFMQTRGMIPFKIETEKLFVAMIDPFDVSTIDDIERITDFNVYPHITLEEEFAEFIEKLFHEE